jgi:sugar-specific transcriptional regulator TrmB
MSVSRHGVTYMDKNHGLRAAPSVYVQPDSKLESEICRSLGLTPNEARLFVVLLKSRSLTAAHLSAMSGIHRTRVYDNLRGLESKHFIRSIEGEPMQFEALPVNSIIDYSLDLVEQRFEHQRDEILRLGLELQDQEYQRSVDVEPAFIIPISNAIEELKCLLEKARARVWVCKRTAGGVIDWFLLKDQLNRLTSAGLDIRFLADSPVKLMYPTRSLESINLSFALVDHTALSFFIDASADNKGRVMVTNDTGYVEFLSSTFNKWWDLAE